LSPSGRTAQLHAEGVLARSSTFEDAVLVPE